MNGLAGNEVTKNFLYCLLARIILAFFFLFSSLFTSSAQTFSTNHIPVNLEGRALINPWAGGLNSPQFSHIDVDRDGLNDILVFDRGGWTTTYYRAQKADETVTYYEENSLQFPQMEEWALFRDFNRDGTPDIFTYSVIGGIEVYRGDHSGSDTISFHKMEFKEGPHPVISYPSGGRLTNLFVASTDVPVIADVDQDGDLDILTFDLSGSLIEYYRNTVVEQGLPPDTLAYVLEERCWGSVIEDAFTNQVILSEDKNDCPATHRRSGGLHAGSAMNVFDPDRDGVFDVLLGDLSFSNLVYLHNGGSSQMAWITDQISNYPSQDPVSLVFPYPSIGDFNDDGLQDFVVAPNRPDAGSNTQHIWYYPGESTNDSSLTFELKQKDFLVETMLDFGIGAFPAFADITGDGLIDLLVGGYNPHQGTATGLHFFENTGSVNEAEFPLRDKDYLSLSTFGYRALIPTPGDLDGDLDQDLLLGSEEGKLIFIENISQTPQGFEFAQPVDEFKNIDVGQYSTPAIGDINGDGLADLILGELSGNLNYFQNRGTAGNPQFNANPASNPNRELLGGIDTRQGITSFGYSYPVILRSGIDSVWLLVGTSRGNVLKYRLQQPETPNWTLADEDLIEVQTGFRSSPAFADLNGDMMYEVMIGNSRGGLELYRSDIPVDGTISTKVKGHIEKLRVFPNPATEVVTIENYSNENLQLKIYNSSGINCLSYSINSNSLFQLNTIDWSPGLYIIVAINDKQWQIVKLVVL